MFDISALTGRVVVRSRKDQERIAEEVSKVIGPASEEKAGLMSAEDKASLEQLKTEMPVVEFGDTEGTCCEGNDPRLSDARLASGGVADRVGSLSEEEIETKEGSQARAEEALQAAKTYADGLIERLMNAPPETLDTLAELAAALGNDPNFATTMATALAQKASKERASSSSDGLMSYPDKAKLDSIEAGANNFVLPEAGADVLGGVRLGHAETGTTTPLQLDASGKAYVESHSFFEKEGLSTGLPADVALQVNDSANAKKKPVLIGMRYGGWSLPAGIVRNGQKLTLSFLSSGSAGTFTLSGQDFSNSAGHAPQGEMRSLTLQVGGLASRYLGEDGLYHDLPDQQERGSIVFTSTGLTQSTTDPVRGLSVPLDGLIPAGIEPVKGRDYVLAPEVGVFGVVSAVSNGRAVVPYETALQLNSAGKG